MSYKFGKFICIFIILAAVAFGIASAWTFPTSPYRHHWLFPSVAILFVTAEILLIIAAIFCLKIIGILEKRSRQGSTFYLNQQIAQTSDNVNNPSFQKRAMLYDIKQEISEITEHQKEILVAKQEVIQLLMLLDEALDHHETIEITVIQNLIESIKQKTTALEVKMELFFPPSKVQHYEQIVQNINLTNLVVKPNEFKKLPMVEKEKIIILDKRIYHRVLKDLKDFIHSNKTYLAVLTLELKALREKLIHKKGLPTKDHLSNALKFLHDVTHEKDVSEQKTSEDLPNPSSSKKPKLH